MDDEIKYKIDENDKDHLLVTKKVEEKGEGVTTTIPPNLREIIEEILAELECKIKRELTKNERKLLMFTAWNNYHKKGVTRRMIQDILISTTDYAEKIIYNLRKNGLIVSSNMRKGRMMTYFLSNMQDYIPVKNMAKKNLNGNTNEYSCLDDQIILILLKNLTANKGVFHNFRLLTRLRDKEDYDLLKVSRGWKLQSERNKIKVMEIRLSRFRHVKLQVSPNGTVEIYIACSKNPYDLHHDVGLSEFFADLGKIDFIFEGESRIFSPVEHFYEWHIVRVDYNYDIEDIDVSYLSSGTTILQVRHLSRLYQLYTKQLPDKGLVLRIEEHLSLPIPYPKIKDFTSTLNK